MTEDMGIVTFICDSFHSIDTCLFSYLFSYENHELANLHAKAETVLKFFSLAFVDLVSMI